MSHVTQPTCLVPKFARLKSLYRVLLYTFYHKIVESNYEKIIIIGIKGFLTIIGSMTPGKTYQKSTFITRLTDRKRQNHAFYSHVLVLLNIVSISRDIIIMMTITIPLRRVNRFECVWKSEGCSINRISLTVAHNFKDKISRNLTGNRTGDPMFAKRHLYHKTSSAA